MTEPRIVELVRATNPYPDGAQAPPSLSRAVIAQRLQELDPGALTLHGATEQTTIRVSASDDPDVDLTHRPPTRRGPGGLAVLTASAAVVLSIGAISLLRNPQSEVVAPTDAAGPDDIITVLPDDPAEVQATGGTALPDFSDATPGDEPGDPLPLGTINELPGNPRLDFLFEFCFSEPCFRDAHFMDPDKPEYGSGPWPAKEPFHIRHGFVNETGEPLPDGFGLSVYVLGFEDFEVSSDTKKYHADYVIQGQTDRCGPTYGLEQEQVTCEWFVHDFPDGLPEGRWGVWAVWEAPCSAWVDMGLTDSCADPTEPVSYFASGFDSPFDPAYTPVFPERDHFGLTLEEIEEILGEPFEDPEGDAGAGWGLSPGVPVDGSGAIGYGSPFEPDRASPFAGDDGVTRPLGSAGDLPSTVRLDFLFEFCFEDGCFRDAHFMDPDSPGYGSGPWPANEPFHIRHGFPAPGEEPLGEGYDVKVYVRSVDEEFGEAGETIAYTADYVIRGESDQCGPTYKQQDDSVTCEWFVHEFPDGLSSGRWALWVDWLAPCAAWLDWGFTDACSDPDEVLTLMSSGVDSPFGDGPFFDEENQARG